MLSAVMGSKGEALPFENEDDDEDENEYRRAPFTLDFARSRRLRRSRPLQKGLSFFDE